MEIGTKTKTPLFSTESQTFENSDCLCARNWSNFVTGYQTTGWSRRNSDISARFCCWSFSKSIDSLKSFVFDSSAAKLKWLMNIFNTCWTNAGCKSKIGVRFDLVSYHFKCDWLDPNGGSDLTKQRLATIENYWKNIGFNGCWTKNHRKTFGTNGWWSYWKTMVTILSFDQWLATIEQPWTNLYRGKNHWPFHLAKRMTIIVVYDWPTFVASTSV